MSNSETPQEPRNPKAEAKAAKAYAKASRPWYKKKRFLGPLGLVVIIAIAVGTSGGTDGPSKVSDPAEADNSSGDGDSVAGSKDNSISVGETVELKGTQYTVESAKTKPTIGPEVIQETANGIYVVVKLTIENKKDETKTFSESAAKFISGNEKSYSTDTEGSMAAAGDGEPLFLAEMQPDVPKTGLLVFDAPKNQIKGGLLEVADLFGDGKAYIDLGL